MTQDPRSDAEGARPRITYASYLGLDRLLSAQHPLSDSHDELLFIIIHQTKELWLKQIIHEIRLAQSLVRSGALVPCYKSLARVSRIQSVMTMSWDILATMTPADYQSFRASLGTSSGFQSAQFREVEYLLGLKDGSFLSHHEESPEALASLQAALSGPSLYDDVLRQVDAHGLALSAAVLDRDYSQAYQPYAEVEDAWLQVYRAPDLHWDLYQLAEKLVDLDDALLTWRHKHVLTVERIIGGKQGTGGTAGVAYLQKTLARRCFPELWTVRTKL